MRRTIDARTRKTTGSSKRTGEPMRRTSEARGRRRRAKRERGV
jgi:hypothetical protein